MLGHALIRPFLCEEIAFRTRTDNLVLQRLFLEVYRRSLTDQLVLRFGFSNFFEPISNTNMTYDLACFLYFFPQN
jgi:hypothetical protein